MEKMIICWEKWGTYRCEEIAFKRAGILRLRQAGILVSLIFTIMKTEREGPGSERNFFGRRMFLGITKIF